MKCFFGNREPALIHIQLLKMSIQQLRERNNNAEDTLRLQRLVKDQQEAARAENQRIEEETSDILFELMKTYLIENHELFVKAIEEYTLEEGDEDSKYEIVFHSLLGGSAFVEFAVENSDIMKEMIELVLEVMIDNDWASVVLIDDILVDLYEELCNAPVLK